MKKKFLIFAILCCYQLNVHAADLLEVYQQALVSDPIFQQAISTRLSTKENVPINLANLLPNLSASINPTAERQGFSGNNYDDAAVAGTVSEPRNNTQYSYTLALTATQVIFDYSKIAGFKGAQAQSKGADATLNAALQDLMVRVTTAYLNILKDEDNLSYSEASKLAYQKQYEQIKLQYDVGLKTITDVYTAQASYETSIATYVAAQNTLDNDKENLRVITGRYYDHLSSLSEGFPFITPQPANIDKWVEIANQQNWTIKSAQYAVETARQTIHQEFAGHLPTLNLTGTAEREYTKNDNDYTSVNTLPGTGTQTNKSIMLTLNLPIFAGGGVTAETNQATYNYQVSEQQLEQTVRSTINTTRQSYLGVLAGISQVKADKQAIKSSISSLEGLQEGYKIGTQTLVNVLTQQQNLFEAQTQYATDRYAYVNNIFALKQAAGTLGLNDLRALNAWLVGEKKPTIKTYQHYSSYKVQKNSSNKKKTKNPASASKKKKVTHVAKKHSQTNIK